MPHSVRTHRPCRSVPALALAAGALLAAACGGSGDGELDLHLFVADMGGDKLLVFDLDDDTGLPVGLHTLHGNAPPEAPAERIIAGPATRLHRPYDVAVDAHGRIFVASLGVAPAAGRLTIFHDDADGNATPRRHIDLTGSSFDFFRGLQPVGIAARLRTEDILASFADQAVVVEFAFGGTSQIPTGIFFGLEMASSSDVAHDANRSRVLVLDRTRNALMAYADLRGNDLGLSPEEELSGPNTLLDDPVSLALDAQGQLYVLNYGSGSVSVYAPNVLGVGGIEGDVAPVRRLGGPGTQHVGLDGATSIAVSPGGRLYAVVGNAVRVWGPGAAGDAVPNAIFTSQHFVQPTGLAVGED